VQQTNALKVVEGTGMILHTYLSKASAPMMLPAEVAIMAHVNGLSESDMLGVLKVQMVVPTVCSSLHLAGCDSARLHHARRVLGLEVLRVPNRRLVPSVSAAFALCPANCDRAGRAWLWYLLYRQLLT